MLNRGGYVRGMCEAAMLMLIKARRDVGRVLKSSRLSTAEWGCK
jgi:hypothetical protein